MREVLGFYFDNYLGKVQILEASPHGCWFALKLLLHFLEVIGETNPAEALGLLTDGLHPDICEDQCQWGLLGRVADLPAGLGTQQQVVEPGVVAGDCYLVPVGVDSEAGSGGVGTGLLGGLHGIY